MRDIAITIVVFGSLPFILRKPFWGVVMWTWLGMMNPHRLAWGFSLNFPFAFIVFLTTVLAFVMSKEQKQVPVSREIVVLIVFIAWMFFSTTQSWYPALAWPQWDKVWRIQLGILLTLMLTNSRERIHAIVWTICISLGFYGAKGGIWTIIHGGANRVYGPDGTFIGGNNEIGLALLMTVPLLWYLIMHTKAWWLRYGTYFVLGASVISIIGTHSRGALVGLGVVGIVFFIKSRRKIIPLVGAGVLLLTLPHIMPQEWFDRMHTIETYEEDASAQNRFTAWRKAFQIATVSVTGGGYDVLIPSNGVDAHSIYFEVLGEHGFTGLAIFLVLIFLTWLRAGSIKRLTKGRTEFDWARDLGLMLQTSLMGYCSAGAFLGLAYFDFFYLLVAVTVVLHQRVKAEVAAIGSVSPVGVAPPATKAVAASSFAAGRHA